MSRKKPGDAGYRAEIVNPAAVANEQEWKKKETQAAIQQQHQTARAAAPAPIQEGLTNKPPLKEGLTNMPPVAEQKKEDKNFLQTAISNTMNHPYIEVAKAGIELLNKPVPGAEGAVGGIAGFGATSVTATGATAILKGTTEGTKAVYSTTIKGLNVNAKTTKEITKFSTRAAKFFKNPVVSMFLIYNLITESLGGKVFGAFIGTEEAAQTVGFPKAKAFDQAIHVTGDFSLFFEAMALENEVLQDKTGWDLIKSFIPWLKVQDGIDRYKDAALSANKIWERMAQNQLLANEKEMPKLIAEQEKGDYKANTDYYNEERKKMVIWETQLRAEARAAEREEDRKAYEKQAAFWGAEKEKQRKKEAQDRIAIAEFWDAYRKKQQELKEQSRPSNLKFGLI